MDQDGGRSISWTCQAMGTRAAARTRHGNWLRSRKATSASARGPSEARPAEPRTALLLVDSRHPGLRADLDAAAWLNRLGVTYHVVATKIDKLARSERAKNLKTLETTFATAVVPVSATSGEGLDELWRTIARLARSAE